MRNHSLRQRSHLNGAPETKFLAALDPVLPIQNHPSGKDPKEILLFFQLGMGKGGEGMAELLGRSHAGQRRAGLRTAVLAADPTVAAPRALQKLQVILAHPRHREKRGL